MTKTTRPVKQLTVDQLQQARGGATVQSPTTSFYARDKQTIYARQETVYDS